MDIYLAGKNVQLIIYYKIIMFITYIFFFDTFT